LPIDTKLCTICDQNKHLAAECPTKQRRQEWKQYHTEQANKFGNLYQRFKPAKTTPIRNIARENKMTNQKNHNQTYASILKNNQPGPSTNQTNPEETNTILDILKHIQADITEIKTKIQDLDERVTWIESTYENEIKDTMEEDNHKQQTQQLHNLTQESRTQSPSQDIRDQQESLHNSIGRIEANMAQVFNLFGEATNTIAHNQFNTNQ
jgi:hypothetical protein